LRRSAASKGVYSKSSRPRTRFSSESGSALRAKEARFHHFAAIGRTVPTTIAVKNMHRVTRAVERFFARIQQAHFGQTAAEFLGKFAPCRLQPGLRAAPPPAGRDHTGGP